MPSLSESVVEYCASQSFFFLDARLKEHAEPMLQAWAAAAGAASSLADVEAGMARVARLDLPLPARQGFPDVLREFFDYLAGQPGFPEAGRWREFVDLIEPRYLEGFRADGSVRGETFRKPAAEVGRNDPCPCGSGKKFKKCCMKLTS